MASRKEIASQARSCWRPRDDDMDLRRTPEDPADEARDPRVDDLLERWRSGGVDQRIEAEAELFSRFGLDFFESYAGPGTG